VWLAESGGHAKQPVSHPLLTEIRQYYGLLAQTLGRIRVDLVDTGSGELVSGSRHGTAALARWYPEGAWLMVRRIQRNDGLRDLLIAEWDRSMLRWRIPGRVSEHEEALKAGKPVVVSSSALLRAFMHAGLPYRNLAYGGRDWGKTFVLDERDQLTEYNDE
jgi:hypothetical protein